MTIRDIWRTVAIERWYAGHALGVFSQVGWLFLVGRESQRMCMEYWAISLSLKWFIVLGFVGLWLAGRLIWWTRMPQYECENVWKIMKGRDNDNKAV